MLYSQKRKASMEKNILKKIENFLKGYKFQKYRKGEIIIRAEDEPQGVFYLEEGFVKKYIISRKGDELTLNIFKPVSRGIKILREKGLVEFSRNKLTVKDIKKLEEELLF